MGKSKSVKEQEDEELIELITFFKVLCICVTFMLIFVLFNTEFNSACVMEPTLNDVCSELAGEPAYFMESNFLSETSFNCVTERSFSEENAEGVEERITIDGVGVSEDE